MVGAELCPGTELNRRHEDFQSSALPTELPGQVLRGVSLHDLGAGVKCFHFKP